MSMEELLALLLSFLPRSSTSLMGLEEDITLVANH